jgi:hypothetical protein
MIECIAGIEFGHRQAVSRPKLVNHPHREPLREYFVSTLRHFMKLLSVWVRPITLK